jgi:hypothetical protein
MTDENYRLVNIFPWWSMRPYLVINFFIRILILHSIRQSYFFSPDPLVKLKRKLFDKLQSKSIVLLK